MAEENQAVTGNEGATPPATEQAGAGKTSPPLGTINTLTLLILLGTAALYAGVVFASSQITGQVVVPKLSTWLAVREARQILAAEVVGEQVAPFGEVYVIEDLVVNPHRSGGMRYACVSVGLESLDPAVIREIGIRDAQVKDLLIQIFGSRTVEELSDVYTREEIRQEVQRRVEEILPAGELDAVYFVNFVLQ
ncbi:MAG: flagellar basal body-associated FliL family protein [Candidatus Eisenbacteria sp.]|nr:flagellar basal body-associated FliL family protein [Candidatus Eisenbacteria bacterium]